MLPLIWSAPARASFIGWSGGSSPKNRTFVDEILKTLGLSHNDTKGIIDVCKGAVAERQLLGGGGQDLRGNSPNIIFMSVHFQRGWRPLRSPDMATEETVRLFPRS